MIINIIISLYTSRLILAALGVVDYGIYNVVGSTVVIVSFLSSTLSSSTSRFLSIAIGGQNKQHLIGVFKTAYTLHIILAGIILLLGETIGVWFVNNILVYPETQVNAVNWVFQFSLAATCISIAQIPYDALLIAHEDIRDFAYFQIASTVMKLGIAFLLLLVSSNRLVIYSVLLLIVSIIMRIAYYVYCKKHYEESNTKLGLDRKYIKEMTSFSGWDLLGHLGFTARQQGNNILINHFFGAVVNAASGIASTVQGVISSFSYNIITAARPQIIKYYANGNFEMYRGTLKNVAVMSMFMILLVSVPLIINLKSILGLWLEHVPNYSYQFTLWCLLSGIVSSVSSVYLIGIHATGRVKPSSLGRNIIYILSLVVVFYIFKRTSDPVWAFIILVITQFLALINDGIILNNTLSLKLQMSLFIQLLIALTISVFSGFVAMKLVVLDNTILYIISSSFIYVILFTSISALLLLSKEQRQLIFNKIMIWRR